MHSFNTANQTVCIWTTNKNVRELVETSFNRGIYVLFHSLLPLLPPTAEQGCVRASVDVYWMVGCRLPSAAEHILCKGLFPEKSASFAWKTGLQLPETIELCAIWFVTQFVPTKKSSVFECFPISCEAEESVVEATALTSKDSKKK